MFVATDHVEWRLAAMHDVIIVGGGVVGLSIARELAVSGRSILVLDRGNLRDTTSWAAAGMIAPQSEASASNPFFDLCIKSARLYPEWVQGLREDSGMDPEYADSGLLCLASDDEGLCRIRSMAGWQTVAGMSADLLSPEETRRMEPQLTLEISGSVLLPSECHITPRLLLEALSGACIRRGVSIRDGVRALEVLQDRGRVTGLRTSAGQLETSQVVIAGGVRSPEIRGLSPAIPVTPRKGQILSLLNGHPGFSRMLRWDSFYIVPRRNGELIVGATIEDAGFDRSITPAGVGGLLDKAQALSASIANLPIGEIWTGLRPATPDGLPILGKADIEGLTYATGHYRNGVLLAPITAALIAAVLDKRSSQIALDAFSPSRFAV